jgi:hypothetical protein
MVYPHLDPYNHYSYSYVSILPSPDLAFVLVGPGLEKMAIPNQTGCVGMSRLSKIFSHNLRAPIEVC